MENNNLINFVQQGFRTVVGATASAIETLQDNNKRNQIVSELTTELQKKSQEWQEKGALTEEEAKKIIEQFFQNKSENTNNNPNYDETVETKAENNPYQNIQQLTQEVIALREELEKIKSS
ncbi:hypothetical protein VKI21_16280 [Cyanobacterium aponinum UTEX 3222]|uniref:Uncharacterized protein n=2 Tax=Cyanobacterium aponinum TaxID=379064 RepID=K9Z552_CYAAP|nr:hypothetical protein [Cyanobacterium aponinum]WRL41588.1 hypothetical protein VKI21_16280 [Cyanobacterium aponinum UTEX 3222]AFZ53543.1 hypothetical protein Cyan10605_1432 [Cyanobacterium aponinum PCC 10605]MBD2395430.1 hypothetical protein [Cyanobacterium aponinum FACHB-4101]PHV63503.1 hypothetical protein CSQ80_05125 [Cyanobacterium aponinum IPPAS B-1201]WPF89780.1 hypothetical protein SAY89_05770 [Cyanobacterium aponinum AL20115]